MHQTYKVAITDDHNMLRKGLANMINSFDGFAVLLQACNGRELFDKLDPKNLPDVALLDVHMPEMDGFETASLLRKTYPQIPVLALSMMDTENAIIRMVKNGARGYVLKDAEPSELNAALKAVIEKGYYYNDLITGKLIFSINKLGDEEKAATSLINMTEKEEQFLKLAATELTYKEIADQLNLSIRTVDGYRDSLFQKLNVRSRVGLAMEAVRMNLVTP